MRCQANSRFEKVIFFQVLPVAFLSFGFLSRVKYLNAGLEDIYDEMYAIGQ